jgi:ankyrin repeat protein
MRIRYMIAAGVGVLALYLTVFGASVSSVADAAMAGDKAGVQAALKQKMDVNAQQADGATAIQWASYRNDLDMADMLIAAGANVKTPNSDGATPLSLASINGNAAMIAKLIKAGADANEKGPRGETPLMYASRNGNVSAIKALLDSKADVNAKETLRGTTALMWAVEQAHPDAAKALIAGGADVKAVTNPDTKGNKAYLAPSVQARAASAQGAGGRANAGGRNAAPAPAVGGRGAAAPLTGGAAGGRGGRGTGAAGAAGGDEADVVALADEAAAQFAFGRQNDKDGGGLTAMVLAARQDCLDCVKVLIEAGADVNQVTHYGWTPLLTATQNRHYKLAAYLLEHGANPNILNNGGWGPLYIATDNRNIEGGDYPVRKPDMDHLEYIKLLIDRGANVNARVCGVKSTPAKCSGDSTETRTNFTMQWLYEDGATPFLRAAQSSDVALMKLLLEYGADPTIKTSDDITALDVASGLGWVEGVTYEWSAADNLETVKLCLDLGIDPNAADNQGRTALHGAAHKGRDAVIQMLVDHGANLEAHDMGSRDTVNGAMKGWTWIPLHYAQGLVRVGVQSAIAHPETAAYIKKLMQDRGLTIPPDITNSICLTKGLNGCE